ncbi:IS5 family transposase [Streptomyces monashensis]|uniref:IS5 family transposase n=1 Tax=Streptomyces monashensis TaxID=1678012 RepID=A0A1S2PFS6_9ACTN|nr:IS5 family transposase [Streptomyces monashensis]
MIPVPADQRAHRLRRGSRGGRPPAFDRERGIATRYEKTATIYLAGPHVTGIFRWSAR